MMTENVNKEDFLEDLGLEDEDSCGTLTWEQIMRIWRIDNLPRLDEDLTEFLKYIALRHSASLSEVRYGEWMQSMSEDYCIGSSQHDCEKPFDYFEERPDSEDLAIPAAEEASDVEDKGAERSDALE